MYSNNEYRNKPAEWFVGKYSVVLFQGDLYVSYFTHVGERKNALSEDRISGIEYSSRLKNNNNKFTVVISTMNLNERVCNFEELVNFPEYVKFLPLKTQLQLYRIQNKGKNP